MMDFIYFVSIVIFVIILAGLSLGIIKPTLAKWMYRPFKLVRPLTRKFIVATAVPMLFATGMVSGSIEPSSARLEREAAEQAKILQDKEIAEQKAAEEKAAAQRAAEKEREQKEAAEKEKQRQEAEKKRAEAEKAAEAAAQTSQTPPPSTTTPQQRTTSSSNSSGSTSNTSNPSTRPTSYVHPGSYCSTNGARGQFKSGNPAICAIDSKGVRLRWQSP